MQSENIEEEQDASEEPHQSTAAEHDRSPRAYPLQAGLSFLVSALLLLNFFTPSLDGWLRMLLLGGGIISAMLGIILLEKRVPATVQHENEQGPILTPFEQLVREALDSIPPEFHEQMDNLVVLVEDTPPASLVEHLDEHDRANKLLLGLYQGVPLTQQSYSQMRLPERITIYQDTIEYYCQGDPERIREQVRHTVLHEVAHHFGIGHKDMPIWLR